MKHKNFSHHSSAIQNFHVATDLVTETQIPIFLLFYIRKTRATWKFNFRSPMKFDTFNHLRQWDPFLSGFQSRDPKHSKSFLYETDFGESFELSISMSLYLHYLRMCSIFNRMNPFSGLNGSNSPKKNTCIFLFSTQQIIIQVAYKVQFHYRKILQYERVCFAEFSTIFPSIYFANRNSVYTEMCILCKRTAE